MKRALYFFLSITFILAPFYNGARAQALPVGNTFDVAVSPKYPQPYSTITVTPSSSLIDLSASTVSVYVNGGLTGQTSGTAPTQIQVGGAGEKTVITVTVSTGAQKSTKTLTIRPSEVSLVEEPSSPTHPFYEGIGLVGSEGAVRLVAIPDLRTSAAIRIPSSNLVFTWKLGDQLLTGSSGIGRSVLNITAPPQFRNAPITLTVSSQDGNIVAQTSIVVTPVDSIVRIYQSDPLLGPLFNRALSGKFTLSGTEASFRAVPYNFSGNTGLTWEVNGTQGGYDKDITVRSQGNGAGTAQLSVSADNADLYQSARTSLSVLFGANKPFGIFGL